MGGGDDLGSDDEYLSSRVVAAGVGAGQDQDDASAVSSGDDKSAATGDEDDADAVGTSNERKRKISSFAKDVLLDDDSGVTEKKKQKKKKNNNRKDDPSWVLLEAARQLERQTPRQQATFLDTALRHYKLLSLSSSSSSSSPMKEEDIPQDLIQPQHIFRSISAASTEQEADFVDRLKEAVSLKKLKKWKHQNSPCVIVVCLSARRAVAVLKDLSRLKIRMAKLFPKNGSVEEQRQQLASNAFSVAVGTPHRLNALLLDDGGGGDGGGASNNNKGASLLTFERTQLIVLDCHVSNKQYTVCTLPDTAPHCMGMLYDHVLPQLQRRKDLQLAFF